MSTTVEPNAHIIPAVRNADEVIDVDAFVERPAQRRRIGRTTNNRDEPIVIPDSDDDDEVVILSEQPRRRLNGGRLASLPPPPQNNIIPPVPPVPWNARAGHIQPNVEPFAFEEDFFAPRQPPRQPSPLIPPLPRAAARSHHRPAMGFGGALIAANRRHQSQQPNGSLTRLLDLPRQLMSRIPFFGQGLGEEQDEEPWIHFAMAIPPEENLFHVRQLRPAAPDYKPEYTHPKHPPPGFTHDFEPPVEAPSATLDDPIVLDDDTESSAISSVTLVCARCFDPLLLTAEMTDPEEVKLRRLWGLRCGHVLDSKCVLELMSPPPGQEVGTPLLPVRPDIKGKGKAVDPPTDELNIRSRLRSRNPAHTPSEPTAIIIKRKRGRGRKPKNFVEGMYEWGCPVKDCGRMHTSLRINGQWVPDKEKGPLGLFV